MFLGLLRGGLLALHNATSFPLCGDEASPSPPGLTQLGQNGFQLCFSVLCATLQFHKFTPAGMVVPGSKEKGKMTVGPV